MAHKQLLLSFLVNILGEFVSGLTEENLKVGVWGGKIKLKNLEINKSGVEKMNLPLTVKEGFLDTLEVKIPWTNLDKQAVQITITGVHLLVGPVDFSTLTNDSAAARCREKRKEQLDRAEKVIEFSAANSLDTDANSTEDLKNSSYKRKILRKMAKNLEVSVHNVHIRYEDSTTLPHQSFNFGVTADSFVFKSFSDQESEIFIPENSFSQMSYKLVTLLNLGLYWNVETSTTDASIVFREQAYNRAKWAHIVCPQNNLQCKIALNYARNADPQTRVIVDNLNVALQLDKFQLHQAIEVQRQIIKANARLEIVQHRPRQSAVDKPLYWWKYLIMLFTNNPNVFTKKIDVAMLCCRHRKRYIEIIVKSKSCDASAAKSGKLPDLTQQEEAEIDIIEELLPIDALIIFRQIATKEALIFNQQFQKDQNTPKKRPSQRFSFFSKFQKKSGDTPGGDVDKETGGVQLDTDSHDRGSELKLLEGGLKDLILSTDTLDNSLFTLDTTISVNMSLTLTSHWHPVVVIKTKVYFDCSVRPTTNVTSVKFTELHVTDAFTNEPLNSRLLEFIPDSSVTSDGSAATAVPPIVFLFEKFDNSSSKISLAVAPVFVHFNILCGYAFSDIFKIKHLDLTWGDAQDDLMKLLNIFDISNTDKTLEVDLRLCSPVVLIPADSSVDCGYLRVQMGDLTIVGKETSNNTVETRDDLASGNIFFQNIGIDFLSSRNDNDTVCKEPKTYCILKPFDFEVIFETMEGSGENFSVDVAISPKLETFLDLTILPQLMRIIDLLTYSEAHTTTAHTRQRTMNKMANILTNVTESSSQAVNDALKTIHSKLTKTNPSICFLKCTAVIPAVSSTIIYDSQAGHEFSLVILNLKCEVSLKMFDFEVCIAVDSLSLRDSFRTTIGQQFVIHANTPMLGSEDNNEQNRKEGTKFVHVVYKQFLHKNSPDYTDHAAGVIVSFGKVGVSLDATLFERIGVLVDAFRHREDVSQLIINCRNEISEMNRCRSLSSHAAEGNMADPVNVSRVDSSDSTSTDMILPTGVNVALKVSEISVMLNKDCASSVLSEVQMTRTPSPIRAPHDIPGKNLESTILIHVQDVISNVTIRPQGYIYADFHIGSVGISDKRDITRDFCYNDILYPFVDSQHSCSFPGSNKSGCVADLMVPGAGDVKKAHHISMSYLQENSNRNVEFIARRFTIFLSFDIILEAMAVVAEHVDGAKRLGRKPRRCKLRQKHARHDRKSNRETVADLKNVSVWSNVGEGDEEDDSEDEDNDELSVEDEDEEIEGNYSKDEKEAAEACKIAESFSVRILVPSPQLIFLENPTEPNSEAVVCRSRTEVHIQQDITAASDPETLSSMHWSLSDLEMFVLLDMQQWHPHQLVQPVTVELHLSTAVTRHVMTQATVSLHVGQVTAKFSLNDLILLQSIWLRRGLVSESVYVKNDAAADLATQSGDYPFIDQNTAAGVSSPLVFHNFFVNLEKMNVVIINDFEGSFIPLVDFTLDQASCKVEGFYQDLHGTGSAVCSVESYNPIIREWEPILEAWNPEFILSSTSVDTSLKMLCDNQVQFNITSVFLDMVLQTMSLLHTFRDGTERELPPAIKFENRLGCPVTLLDGQTKKVLFRLNHDDVANIFLGQQSSGYHFMSNEKSLLNLVLQALPDTIDMYFQDADEAQCVAVVSPIIHLPLHVIKYTNMYPMKLITAALTSPPQPQSQSQSPPTSVSSASSSSSLSSPPLVVSVVEEELFEYQRYNPLMLSWVDPFLSSDPHRWSDVTGTSQKFGKNSVHLPKTRGWEWVEDWKIDVSAKLGVQIDSEGFHYGFDFYGICGKSETLTLRTFRPMDCVRRRRWVRKRSLKQSHSDDLHMFWEVNSEMNGSKVVTIRSNLQIFNSLPFDVSAHLDNGVVIGPMSENSTVCVPLHQAKGVTSLTLNPSFLPCGQSPQVNCSERASDFISLYNLTCLMQSDQTSYLSFNSLVRQSDKSIHVSIFPHAVIFNALPCSVKFKFTNSNGDVMEQDFLDSAESRKLCFLTLREINFVSLQMSASSEWSPTRQMHKQRNSILTIPLYSNGKLMLKVYVKVTYLNTNMSKIEIFTKCAFVDYSTLNMCLSSRIADSMTCPVVRHAYESENITLVSSFSSHSSYLPGSLKIGEATSTLDNININTDLIISNFNVRSRRQYRLINSITIGDLVHTDRELRFMFIPEIFQHQTYICTACEDRTVLMDDRSTHSFINFNVSSECMVFIMIDNRASIPLWIRRSKFVRVLDPAVARGVYNGTMQDIHYSLLGKIFGAGDVHLGSNFSKDARCMYGVFVISAPLSKNGSGALNAYGRLLSQLRGSGDDANEKSSRNWCSGGQGVVLFNTDQEGVVLLGVQTSPDLDSSSSMSSSVKGGSHVSWSQTEVNVKKTITGTKIPFEVVDLVAQMSYQLVYKVESLPGVFHRMKILEVMPRYLIVNATGQPLYLRHDMSTAGGVSKADDVFAVQPYCTKGWHKKNVKSATSLQVRFPTTDWCLGAFDINEIGSSEVLLVSKSQDMSVLSGGCLRSYGSVVVNVEVKLAHEDDKCSVCVLFWISTEAAKSPLSISNNSSFMISISQDAASANVSKGNLMDLSSNAVEVKIPPMKCIPYGWTNPCFDAPRTIFISVGDSIDSEVGKTEKVNVLDLHQRTNLFLMQMPKDAVAVVTIELQSTGRIIKISNFSMASDCLTGDVLSREAEVTRTLSINLSMRSIGLSLVASLPRKRELVSFHIDDFSLIQTHLAAASTVELTIGNVQVDNYSETAVYPVMFRRHDESFSNNNGSAVKSPFIQAAVLKESVNETHKISYFSLRVLNFVIELDSGSIHILLSDLFSGIDFVSTDKLKALSHPVEWMSDYNCKLMSTGRYELTNIERLLQNSHQSRTLFENIIIHPTQCFLTFVHTERPTREDMVASSSSYVDLLASIGAVDLMVIRLNSFIVSNAVESLDSLKARIWAKIKRDVKMQLAQIAGSLTILGSPVGLVRNVGGGVKSFFYEPAVGLVQSPLSFILGIQKGTTGLVSGVLSGTLNTTAALVGTASSGISFLSGDREYMQNRSLKMKMQQAARGGALSGLMDGGIAAFTGIASGVSGVILRPVEGAQRGGAVGFIKGVGMGIAGAAVKPVLGVTDGVTSIVQGISNEVGQSYGYHHIRPPRAFKRISSSPHARLLSRFDMNDALAQQRVVNKCKQTGTVDEFISQITMGFESQIIFSEKCVWWVSKTQVVVLLWDDISYVLRKPGIIQINRSVGSSVPLNIPVSQAFENRVHSIFLSFADKMTNPSVMRNAIHRELGEKSRVGRPRGSSMAAPLGSMDITYVFGCHNYDLCSLMKLREEELILQARAKFLMAPGRTRKQVNPEEDSLDSSCIEDNQCAVFEYVDITVSWLIRQWDLNHSISEEGRSLSYCCAALIFNESSQPVGMLATDIVAGRALWSLGSEGSYCAFRCDGCDDPAGGGLDTKRLIPAGGYVLLLACGNTPSFFHSGNIEVKIQTSAFDILVTSDMDRTAMVVQKSPFESEFAEKTNTDSWSKYVLVVSDRKP